MKNPILVLILALSSVSAFADSYTCTIEYGSYDDFGTQFEANVTARKISLTDTRFGTIAGKIDANYKPRAQNAGSIRFNADVDSGAGSGTGCDSAKIMLNSAMTNGNEGRLTIAYDCDSDGNGPIFMNYHCKK